MVGKRIVETAGVRKDSHSPVRLQGAAAQVLDFGLRPAIIELVPPKGDGRQHRVFVNQARLAQLAQTRLAELAVRPGLRRSRSRAGKGSRESVKAAVPKPVGFFDSLPRALRAGSR